MKALEIINKYDEVSNKAFSIEMIIDDLREEKAEQNEDFENKAEYLAFISGLIGPKGKYLFPERFINKIDDITDKKKVFDYYESRAETVKNPILKIVYYGAIVEFKNKCINGRVDIKLIRTLLDIIRKIVNEEYYKYEYLRFNVSLYGFIIAINTKDESIKSFAKETLMILAKKAKRFDTIIDILRLSYHSAFNFDEKEINELILILDGHFNNLSKIQGHNYCSLYSITKAELEYYNRKRSIFDLKLKETINRLLNLKAYNFSSRDLMEIAALCKRYNLHEEHDSILLEIQDKIKTEAQIDSMIPCCIIIKSKLSNNEVEELSKKSLVEIISAILSHIIPDIQVTKNDMSEKAGVFPLSYMCNKGSRSPDQTGRNEGNAGSITKQPNKNLIYELRSIIKQNYISLISAINILKDIKFKDDCLTILLSSKAFQGCGKETIDKLVNFYYEKDYMSFCFIVVPQIERALRDIKLINGDLILKRTANLTQKTILLEDILKENKEQNSLYNTFDDNTIKFFRTVLIEDNGFNIRNNLCHGYYTGNETNYEEIADLLMIIILCIATKTINNSNNDNQKMTEHNC